MNTTSKFLRLVAPICFGAITLFGSEASPLRSWTDVQGRSIQARLLAPPVDGAIRIERADGQVFTLNVTRLSTADQAYLASLAAPPPSAEELNKLRELTQQDWDMLAQLLSLSPRTYANAPADEVVAMLNTRLASSDFRLPDGRPISIRLEGEAAEARINTEIRYPVNLSTFLQDVTKRANLELRLDPKQQLVLVAATKEVEKIKFLGL
jgi:hypothetical protein